MSAIITILALALVVVGLYMIRVTITILATILTIVVSIVLGATNAHASATDAVVGTFMFGNGSYIALVICLIIACVYLAVKEKSFICVLLSAKFGILLYALANGYLILV